MASILDTQTTQALHGLERSAGVRNSTRSSSDAGPRQRPLEHLRQLPPIRGPTRPPRKILKELPGVVGLAEEGAIEPLRDLRDSLPRRHCNEHTEDRSGDAAQNPPLRFGHPHEQSARNTAAKAKVSATPITMPTSDIAWCTTTYRALRRRSTGISITRCRTTA